VAPTARPSTGLGESAAHGLTRPDRFQKIGAGKDGGKLLATEASDHARPVAVSLRRGGEQLEHTIAQSVPVAIIGLFEMIEVEMLPGRSQGIRKLAVRWNFSEI